VVKPAQESANKAAVTRHLVGAILCLTFPEANVDDPTGPVAGQNLPLGHYLVGIRLFITMGEPESWRRSQARYPFESMTKMAKLPSDGN
jgi:hypothetical protein